jgi:hypothetical protein
MNAPRFPHPPRLGVCEDEDCPLCAPMTVSDDLVPFFALTPEQAPGNRGADEEEDPGGRPLEDEFDHDPHMDE